MAAIPRSAVVFYGYETAAAACAVPVVKLVCPEHFTLSAKYIVTLCIQRYIAKSLQFVSRESAAGYDACHWVNHAALVGQAVGANSQRAGNLVERPPGIVVAREAACVLADNPAVRAIRGERGALSGLVVRVAGGQVIGRALPHVVVRANPRARLDGARGDVR